MYHVLAYEYVDEMLERRKPYREAHLARVEVEREAKRIVMAGPVGDPQPADVGEAHEGEAGSRAGFKPTGALIVFDDRVEPEEIEEWVRGDPYFEAGLVTSWRVEAWAAR